MTHRNLLPRAKFVAALFIVAPMVCLNAVPAGAVDDVDAFQKTLRQQNDKHLRGLAPAVRQATSSMIDAGYVEGPEQGPWELRDGKLSISVELKRTAPIDLSAFPVPVLTVSLKGKPVLTATGPEGQPDFVSFIAQLVEMDPGNPYPEIVFSVYTGGAHCCSDTRVITSGKDGKEWSEIEVGMFDGGPLAATDADGDGRFEFVLRDNRFLYTFGCYACSPAPLQMLRLEGEEIIDVSGEEEFRDAHRTSLVNMLQYDGGSDEANGFLAGYVGQKIRLGEGREAWDFMLKFHDRKSDWGLEQCSVALDSGGKCPGHTVRMTFPEALRVFLEEAGYPLPD